MRYSSFHRLFYSWWFVFHFNLIFMHSTKGSLFFIQFISVVSGNSFNNLRFINLFWSPVFITIISLFICCIFQRRNMSGIWNICWNLLHWYFLFNDTSIFLELILCLLFKTNSLSVSKMLNISEFLSSNISSNNSTIFYSNLWQNLSQSFVFIL